MSRYGWLVPYGVIWTTAFLASLAFLAVLRSVWTNPKGLLLAAGAATAVVAVEVVTDRAEQGE